MEKSGSSLVCASIYRQHCTCLSFHSCDAPK
jgi:hypothetical protein